MPAPPCLLGLPSELLDLIVYYFESTNSLLQLALTCRRLSQYVKLDGYRVYVQTAFPFSKTSSDWQSTAKSLTALSRAWKIKAFVARDLAPARTGPSSSVLSVTRHESSMSGSPAQPRQSMGYQPAIACLNRGDAGSTLAWGAGAELIIRSTDSETEPGEGKGSLQWIFWKDPTTTDGKHDITSVNLLGSQQLPPDVQHNVFIGRAGGRLERVRVVNGDVEVQRYNLDERSIRSAHTNSDPQPLLVVGLDNAVALYDTRESIESQNPISEMQIAEEGQGVSTWTVRFIGNRRVGVGRGPSNSVLRVFQIQPHGAIAPLQEFISARKDSLYCIEPLVAPRGASELLLAGWYSGSVTLHDLRIRSSIVLSYEDPIDPSSPIYSLCSFANDRFVAGGGRHSCIKIFDLRMSGSYPYAAGEIEGQKAQTNQDLGYPSFEDYSVFLRRPGRRNLTSPVYSLAKASEYSSNFYAGLENHVMQLDLYSMSETNARPDPRLSLANRLDEPRTGPKVADEAGRLAIVGHTRSGAPPFWTQRLNNAKNPEFAARGLYWMRGGQEEPLSPRQGFGGNESLARRPFRRNFRH